MIQLTRRQFLRLVQQAFEGLPDQVKEALDNVEVVVERWPSRDLLASSGGGGRYDLLGLYVGVPLSERGSDLPPLPDKITLFQRPIERHCDSLGQVVHEVQVTLLHEVGHYFGMSEADLHQRGYS